MKLYQKVSSHVISTESNRSSFDKNYDLIVAGLGCSGSFSAISAAQEGVSVLGIERTCGLGGMSTLGSVIGYYFGLGGGMFEQIDKECVSNRDVYQKFGYHPDSKQYNIARHLKNNNVDTMFESIIIGLYIDNNRIMGVKVFDGKENKSIGCNILIDATSDGHIIGMCDVKTFIGRETDGKTVPFTSMMACIEKDGSYRTINKDSGYCNQYDAYDFSKKIIEGHSNNTYILKQEKKKLLYIAPKIGVREGLRFEGEKVLTLSDLLEKDNIEKPLIYAYSDLDKHGHDTAVDSDLYQDWWVVSNLATVTIKIPVPIGSVIPKGLKGIMSSGRCLAVDSYISSAVRMNRDMYRLGEAQGVLAAMSIKSGKDIAEVDYPSLKKRLLQRNCFDSAPLKKIGFGFPDKPDSYKEIEWMTDYQEIKQALSTDKPGVAIWSCRILGKKVADFLYETMLSAEEKLLKYNCAIALGIIKDIRSLTVLREIVKERSSFYFKDCRRSNQFRSVAAICLIGRFFDLESLDMLCEIVFSEKEIERKMYHELEPNYLYYKSHGFNFVFFQHFTHAAMAIVKIAEKHPDIAEDIYNRFKILFSDEEYIRKITDKDHDTSEYREIYDVANYILSRIEK